MQKYARPKHGLTAAALADIETSPMASRLGLSTVHRGVAFEQRSLDILQSHLSMSLRMVGGKSDGGIDLQGWWWLPPITRHPSVSSTLPMLSTGRDSETRRRLRVLGQCKAEKKKMGPNYVREMEGVLHRHLSTTGDHNMIVALLVSQSAFTRATILRAFSSPIPFFLLHLPPLQEKGDKDEVAEDAEEEGNTEDGLGAAIWNPALGGEGGLLGGEIEVRWERSLTLKSGRPGLWWKGKRLKSWVPPGALADSEESAKED